MPAIYHEGSWLGNATDPEVLVKDTVGWTGKNRAYSQTNNAVIAHIENGITYDVSWTGSATVTLKKNSASGATITSGSTSPLSFTADADYELYFGSSATVTNIMVKDSRITDPTYEPYHESVEDVVEQIYADNGVLGAKNLLPNELKAKTVGGVTVTINDDNSVTLNGTATETLDNLLELSSKINDILEVGKRYVLTGCPANGGLNSYALVWRLNNASAPGLPGFDDGDGSEFTWQQFTGYVAIRIRIQSGYTCNNLTFKPMLRLASDPDDTYQPYAMTNRELTDDGLYIKRVLTSSDDLNSITKKGIYYVRDSVPAHMPESKVYCPVIVFTDNGGLIIYQMVLRPYEGIVYMRSGSPSSFNPWYKIAGTVVS